MPPWTGKCLWRFVFSDTDAFKLLTVGMAGVLLQIENAAVRWHCEDAAVNDSVLLAFPGIWIKGYRAMVQRQCESCCG